MPLLNFLFTRETKNYDELNLVGILNQKVRNERCHIKFIGLFI